MNPLSAASASLLAVASIYGANAEATQSQTSVVTLADLRSGGLWKPSADYNPLIDTFYDDAERLGKMDVASRQSIADKYDLTTQSLDAAVSFMGRMETDRYKRDRQPELRSEALRLVKLSHRAPIALMLAAGALSELPGLGCTPRDITALMNGSFNPERDWWAIATSCGSSAALAMAIDQTRSARSALLYLGLNWTRADPASTLAAADMLLRPEFLAQVDERDRDEIHAEIARDKLSRLLDVGLLRDAVAFGDSLSPTVRTLALRGRHEPGSAAIGGFTVKRYEYFDFTAIDYAAALALEGRSEDARAVLDVIAPPAAMKQARACLASASGQNCHVGEAAQGLLPLGALVVDQLLEEPDADPYPLLEAAAAGQPMTGGGVVEALCRLLSGPDEHGQCEELREATALARGEKAERSDDLALWSAIGRADGQAFATAKARYLTDIAALAPAKSPREWTRATIEPAPLPFRELSLAASALTNKPTPPVDPKSLAPLPQGYAPVRIERSGDRVVAISLSQRFDPDGEVSRGGYWLHLSDDGGKSWQPPLYTGLADHFPYVVPASSQLPMIAGDSIHLEVEESLIDTASITYPPVGTRVRRKRNGIYLDIPIAELRKDGNGDGITDIAAHHLLLDSTSHGQTPFVVGSDTGCSRQPEPETLARLEILKKLFHVEASALIEPVGGKKVLFGGWQQSAATEKAPIFLRGNSDDYRCLAIDRLMVVYSDADEQRLKTFSPDFHLIELPPIRWNRAHTRGFLKWSMGWTGGTYRLVRDGSGWKIEVIGQWIT